MIIFARYHKIMWANWAQMFNYIKRELVLIWFFLGTLIIIFKLMNINRRWSECLIFLIILVIIIKVIIRMSFKNQKGQCISGALCTKDNINWKIFPLHVLNCLCYKTIIAPIYFHKSDSFFCKSNTETGLIAKKKKKHYITWLYNFWKKKKSSRDHKILRFTIHK